ncbi:MAG: ferritin-like domain-containing protein, partial [Burkholderiaceae bacterium]|nr:ferritin-like domain-containing protein [Burkholderiaceae bacterium]
MELRLAAFNAFIVQNPSEKVSSAGELYAESATLLIATNAVIAAHTDPGMPARPLVLNPLQVDKRSPFTLEGHAALMHAICHIEFNAINLALDAIWRFPHMPDQYYLDWAQVAKEEAYHFSLLRQHLQGLGFDYGDFPAHGGLWAMCEKTIDDVVARMALVPRTMEARGL